ncbi:Imm1 family immunity protein [Paractinoplanes atraurantiacus]|uniref:Immunity protein Imm1 n=1 Tax=Paractinoplanes atraurantiacus TaxID=1036182 RepID=A0A285JUG1_9ACTN|nr:Imm1 family immunity protein [Actinoplanes atraurantiacus]SNY62956.1 Immunity protein Imm1 [Actinoplanes atraurantiacus]
MRARIAWRSDDPGMVVTCDEELRWAPAEAEGDAGRRPLIAEVVHENGDSLLVGLGREISVLSYVGASKNPPYFSSRGSSRSQDGEAVVFFYFGHWSEFPASATVSAEEAVEAARFFIECGELSPRVDWVEV